MPTRAHLKFLNTSYSLIDAVHTVDAVGLAGLTGTVLAAGEASVGTALCRLRDAPAVAVGRAASQWLPRVARALGRVGAGERVALGTYSTWQTNCPLRVYCPETNYCTVGG